ncbi:uncharacterized protein G2W53_001969 [Senna tora]|uniref:Uncharacterized protein n=1 Tax=Senna tora TaxID=362788 RepID=A0A834XGY0_9FABA|nr:uncharacterized protein G2W53_001969 [Senna tora]
MTILERLIRYKVELRTLSSTTKLMAASLNEVWRECMTVSVGPLRVHIHVSTCVPMVTIFIFFSVFSSSPTFM